MTTAVRDYGEYWSRLKGSHHHHPANRFRYWLVLRKLRASGLRFESVMDIGCGDGSLLVSVMQAFAPKRAVGLDVSPVTIPALQEKGLAEFHQADLGKPLTLSLPPVDLALSSEVIEHVPDDDAFLRNAAKLVKPGGHLLLTTQSGPIRKTERFLGHLRHYDLDALAAKVEAAGFRVLEKARFGWPLLNLQKALAERFYSQVTSKIIDQESVSLPMRLVFACFYHGYKLCSFGGPQLLILARKA